MSDTAYKEVELKLRVINPEKINSIFSTTALEPFSGHEPKQERLEAWYYDTDNQLLQKAGLAYRIRLENGQWVATIKSGGTSAGGLHERQEWNIPVDGPIPDVEHLRYAEAAAILSGKITNEDLTPLFCTAFNRQKLDLKTDDGSSIELAVDFGEIAAGEKREQIAEIELELKSGNPANLLKLGAKLSEEIPLTVEIRSKFYRGLCLAELESTTTPKDYCHIPETNAKASTMVNKMLINQIDIIFRAQNDFLQNSIDAESLHQLRIQIRKLRSILSFAQPLMEEDAYEYWQKQFRCWGQSMGKLRELDVMLETWRIITDDNEIQLSPPPWLGMLLKTERDNLTETLASSISQGQSTPLLLGFWSCLYGSAFAIENDDSDQPGLEFAINRLSAWLKEMRDIAKKATPDDLSTLHELRILGKKLRYTLEVLPLVDRKTRLMLARLKRLQDNLGDIRDTKVAADSLNNLMNLHASRLVHRDAGIMLGWITRSGRESRENLDRHLRRFKRISKRWLRDREQ